MITPLQPGLYVLAVSGGVDSVVLLDILAKNPDLRLIVAHYDHGIREDSAEDRRHVARLAEQYHIPFVFEEGKLDASASENAARTARYRFLHTVRDRSGAKGIITAHHQDDLIETALLNVMRGTNRKGLTSLQSTDILKRPLLHIPKIQMVSYARANGLVWREDSTNVDKRYTRNALRARLKSHLSPLQRQHMLAHIRRMQHINHQTELLLANHLHIQPSAHELDRAYFLCLPFDVAREILAAWLRKNGVTGFDAKILHRVTVATKTYTYGRKMDVYGNWFIAVNKDTLALKKYDR